MKKKRADMRGVVRLLRQGWTLMSERATGGRWWLYTVVPYTGVNRPVYKASGNALLKRGLIRRKDSPPWTYWWELLAGI